MGGFHKRGLRVFINGYNHICPTHPGHVLNLARNTTRNVNFGFYRTPREANLIAVINPPVIYRRAGSCYRTGGDEFAAILDTDDSPTVEAALHKMEDAQKAYNTTESPPVPLQIAYGYAVYDPKHTALEIAENTADERMYEMKRRMKATR